jgi:hypothetical protein
LIGWHGKQVIVASGTMALPRRFLASAGQFRKGARNPSTQLIGWWGMNLNRSLTSATTASPVVRAISAPSNRLSSCSLTNGVENEILAPMTFPSEISAGIVRVAPFASFFQRFDELIRSSSRMALYFIHSRRWRENHDSSIKTFLGQEQARLEVFLPDLESHELMFSLSRHFEDGPQIPGMVADAYRYFARLARTYNKPTEIWLFGRYPTYSFYQFDQRAVLAFYSNTASKKELPAFEVESDGLLGTFLAEEIEDLKKECRRRDPRDLEGVITNATEP